MILLRSTIFNLWFYGSTFVCTLAACLSSLISASAARGVTRGWAKANVAALRIICGIKIEVLGWDLIPGGPVIIASQHQSALDTFIWFALLANGVYVLKQELIQIPILGWLLLRLGNIAVDRAAGASALRGLLKEGSATLHAGRIVVIFPEGTRVAAGERGTLHPGVAALASYTGAPVLPVATDSGYCWGRNAFTKRPGIVHVVIQPALPIGLKRPELIAALQRNWDDGQRMIGAAVDNSVGQIDQTAGSIE